MNEHNHEHNHHHDHENCGDCAACSGCAENSALGEIRLDWKLHEGAVVISASLTAMGDSAAARLILERGLTDIAGYVTALGGIIGHIKASLTSAETETFSITDTALNSKISDEQRVKINLVVIVFGVEPEAAAQFVRETLERIKSGI